MRSQEEDEEGEDTPSALSGGRKRDARAVREGIGGIWRRWRPLMEATEPAKERARGRAEPEPYTEPAEAKASPVAESERAQPEQ